MRDDLARARLELLDRLTAVFNRPHMWVGDASLTRFVGFLAGIDAASGLVPGALQMPHTTEAFGPFRRPLSDGQRWLPLVVLEALASRPLPDEKALDALPIDEQKRLRNQLSSLYARGFDELRRRHAAEHGLTLLSDLLSNPPD